MLHLNKKLINEHMQRMKAKLQRKLELDPDALRWTPLISNLTLIEEEKRVEKEVGFQSFTSRIFSTLCSACKKLNNDIRKRGKLLGIETDNPL